MAYPHNRPVAIWTSYYAEIWHKCSDELKEAWDNYANEEAQKDADAYIRDGSARNPMTLHQWKPRLTIDQWLIKNGHFVPDHRLLKVQLVDSRSLCELDIVEMDKLPKEGDPLVYIGFTFRVTQAYMETFNRPYDAIVRIE